jgi:hypothetical protein
MGLRVGILLGFLAGAVAKTIVGKPGAPDEGVAGMIRAHFRQAISEGKEAAAEKEEEIRQDYERTTRQ